MSEEQLKPLAVTFMLMTLLCAKLAAGGLYQVSSIPTSEDVLTADWSPDDRYIISGRKGNAFISELSVFSYSSQLLTQVSYLDFGAYSVNSVRWHPTSTWVAVATVNRSAGDELLVYNVDTNAGTLNLLQSTNIGRDVTALAWHPVDDYLAVGYTAGSNEVEVFHVAPTGMSLAATGGVFPEMTVSREALDWSPLGSNPVDLVVGYDAVGLGNAVQVYRFNSASQSLTTVVQQAPNVNATAVDWGASNSLIVVGFESGYFGTSVHVFELSSSNTLNTRAYLSSVARPAVLDVDWGPADDALIVSWAVSAPSEFELYGWDGSALTFRAGVQKVTEYNTLGWDHAGEFIAGANDDNFLSIHTTTEVDRVLSKYESEDPLVSGSNLTYFLSVTNLGPGRVYRIRIDDPLPADVNFVSAGPSQGSCSLSNTTVVCDIGELAAGSSAIVTVQVHVAGTASGMLSNGASLNLLGNDIDAANDSAFALTSIPDSDSDATPDFLDDDDDEDGMTDDFEVLYFGGRTNGLPLVDSDGDLFNNLDEFVAGSNPRTNASYFRFSGITGGAGRSLQFHSVTGRWYDVWYSTSLVDGTWMQLATNVAGAGGTQTVVDPSSGESRAYRLGVEMQ